MRASLEKLGMFRNAFQICQSFSLPHADVVFFAQVSTAFTETKIVVNGKAIDVKSHPRYQRVTDLLKLALSNRNDVNFSLFFCSLLCSFHYQATFLKLKADL